VEERDLVLLEEVEDAVVVLRDDPLLARQHLRHVDGEAVDLDAVIRERVSGMLEVLGGLQERLGRDAADVGACPSGAGLPSARDQSSMQAVANPSCAARMAAVYPPGPAPITTTS
jgi:hypothetical protein